MKGTPLFPALAARADMSSFVATAIYPILAWYENRPPLMASGAIKLGPKMVSMISSLRLVSAHFKNYLIAFLIWQKTNKYACKIVYFSLDNVK
jgi:hypothetical protein